MAINANELGSRLLELVGGPDNVTGVQNCMTRLRFTLRDESKADEAAVKAEPGVQGVMRAGGQFQIVIGKGVEDVRAAVEGMLPASLAAAPAEAPKMKWYERVLDVLSGSMIPLIGVLIGAGMILALNTLLGVLGVLDTEGGTYQFFNAVGNCAVYFLPVFVGYTSAKKMNADPMLGMFLGAVLLLPSLQELINAEGGLTLFGMPLTVFSYGGTVVPVLLAVLFLSFVEPLVRKVCPKVISSFAAPMMILLICVPVTYLVIGPLGALCTNAIMGGVSWLGEHAGFLAIGVIAALLPILVMSGLHMALIPIMITIMASAGCDGIVSPGFLVYNICVAGACAALGLRKGGETRSTALSSSFSALLGVTEPGLFGTIVALGRSFPVTIAACGVAGLAAGLIGYAAYVPMSQSVLSIPAAATPENMIRCTITCAAAFAIGFVTNWFFGIDKKAEAAVPKTPAKPSNVGAISDEGTVCAPVSGTVEATANIPDPLFSSEGIGRTVGVWPVDGNVYAPVSGTVTAAMPHAVGITGADGAEVLVHIGVDTVDMGGDGFTVWVTEGQVIAAGDALVTFDRDKVKAAGHPDIVMTIITNSDELGDLKVVSQGAVTAGDALIRRA